jgi:capsular exopolysaccharide synthesis family protein
LEKEVKTWESRAQEISRQNAAYQRLKAHAQRAQALYDRLLSVMQTLDLNRQINPESVTIMENASAAVPAREERWRYLLAGGMGGLALGLAALMLLDRFDDRMNSVAELQEYFSEEVLGQIPRQNGRGTGQRAGLIQPGDKRPAFVEAYRNLRSSLLYLAESGRRPKTLLVTSALPNEGKSLTAANLASLMASAGARVLLVDADLRKGTLHDYFGQPTAPGLDEVLAESVDWRKLTRSTHVPNLVLLPRGRTTQSSSELLMSKEMEVFLQAAAAECDYLLLDTAPVMATDDATSLAPQVDGVVFLIRAEQTSARVARAGLDMLYQRGANVLGVVFNGVHPQSNGYSYYQYQDYYHTAP